jgi:hypothetical protein
MHGRNLTSDISRKLWRCSALRRRNMRSKSKGRTWKCAASPLDYDLEAAFANCVLNRCIGASDAPLNAAGKRKTSWLASRSLETWWSTFAKASADAPAFASLNRRRRLERVTRLELATSSLARRCSTTELHPHSKAEIIARRVGCASRNCCGAAVGTQPLVMEGRAPASPTTGDPGVAGAPPSISSPIFDRFAVIFLNPNHCLTASHF